MTQYAWGPRSKQILEQLDPRLQLVMNELLQHTDVSLICGHRTQAEQDLAYSQGRSKTPWPKSKHNRQPSLAVDFIPAPYPQDERILFGMLAYIAATAIGIGKKHGITLRWGGDWNRNGLMQDNKFNDLFHLEIVE